MITCYLQYVIDPDKVAEFEEYGRMWIPLVVRFGGRHHGYFLPHESANNLAVALLLRSTSTIELVSCDVHFSAPELALSRHN